MDLEGIRDHVPVRITDAPREAAVLAPVLDRDGEVSLLFTKRAEHLGKHPGQMSFPGGGRESVDRTLLDTARREAWEEIGLRPEEADAVGQLDDIRTVTDYVVTPFVARVPDRDYRPDDREVAEVAVLPVSALLAPDNHEVERREHPQYGDHLVHYFHVDGYTVWGATARILVQLLELATGWSGGDAEAAVADPNADP